MSSIVTTRKVINSFLARFFGVDPAKLPKRQLMKHLPRAVFCPGGKLNEAFLPHIAPSLVGLFPESGKTAEELIAELKRENLTGILEGLGNVYRAVVRERERVLSLARQGNKLRRINARLLALQNLVTQLKLDPSENRKTATRCIREGLGFSGVRVYTLDMESGKWLHEYSEGEEGVSNFGERKPPNPNSEKAFLTRLLRLEISQEEIDRAQGKELYEWHLNGEWGYLHIPDRGQCEFVDREQLRKDEEGDSDQQRNGYGSGGAREILYLVFGGRDQKEIEVYMITNWKSGKPLFVDKEEELGLLHTFARAYTQVKQHAEDHQRVVEDSVHDELTGIYNRRYFERKLRRETARNLRMHRPTSLAILDIDHFKEINDQHGHPFGDQVLKEIAQIMKRSVRRRLDAVCRIGGEEFAIILPELDLDGGTGEVDAVKVVNRVREAVERHDFIYVDPRTKEQKVVKVTISGGVCSYRPAEGIDQTIRDMSEEAFNDFIDEKTMALYGKADSALYQAKNGGRNRVERHQKPS
jgi:diguanylate cyclase (GGDEF)-like protein